MGIDFTTSQLEAISTLDRPLQIIACAGSGKTEVISQRIAAILAQPGVRPANIVAFTFTEKAAAELKDRVYGILTRQGRDLTGMAEMFIGTIHAYCLNLLQTWVPETFKFSVLTQITQRLFIDRHSDKSGLTRCPTMLDNVPTLRRYRDSKLYAQIMSILSEDDVDHTLVPGAVEACWTAYRQLLGGNAYVDYSTMLELAVELLERHEDQADVLADELRHYVEETVRYVVVDEYQDVNPIQERLVAALTEHGANLCVVGDDDQTIYQWRGSDVSGILKFADRYEAVHNVTLAENFRSSEGIVALGRSIAESIPSEQRLAKSMAYASHQQWERGDMLSLKFDDPEAEATWMADRLEAIRGVAFTDDPDSDPRGLSWSDMAVLYRSVAGDAGSLTDELDKRGIPYVVKGLTRLFDSTTIQAVVAMFAFTAGQLDRDGLEAMIGDARLVDDGTSLDPLVAVLERVNHPTPRNRHTIYNFQRLYLDALAALGVREDTIPGKDGRGALVMYELGKFSQVIS
ncbi:MAG: ATP-dependent helicase, partial [Propionibacteriaceae bacterium]|nr:ATP-dependent helicase [Propionibacteriaceae bacterium]